MHRVCRSRSKGKLGADGGTSNTERLAAQKVALSSSTLNDQDNVFGTFDWKRLRFKATGPADVTDAELILGVEAVNGSAQFDDIKLSVLRRPRAWPAVPPKGPVLTSHEKPRLRGAMIHPDITPESSRVRGQEWKVNLIRWQLR